MASTRITQQSLATELGIHKSTVSRALKKDPRLDLETIQQVCDLAKARGYFPDPALSALSQERWRLSDRHGRLNWGYLRDETLLCPVEKELMTRMAAELGYNVTEIRLNGESRASVVNRMLKARGVCGIIFGRICSEQLFEQFDWENLDWDLYSWVALNEERYAPKTHIVLNNTFQATQRALKAVQAHGYRRIAFLHESGELSKVNVLEKAAYLQFQFAHPDVVVADFVSRGVRSMDLSSIIEFDPDALLLGFTGLHDRLSGSLARLPWATLAKQAANPDVAGIDLDIEKLCRSAGDLLDFQYRRRERGLPNQRRITFMVDSPWSDGTSLPFVR